MTTTRSPPSNALCKEKNVHTDPTSPYRKGVAFTVIVDAVKRECLITQQALHTLSGFKRDDSSEDIMEIYRAFEANINGIARRLVVAGVADSPIVIRPETFSSPRTY